MPPRVRPLLGARRPPPRPRRSALEEQLVAMPRPVAPPTAQGQTVGMPQALPGMMRYGPEQRGPTQSTRFTGGVSENPVSLTHPEETPTFREPSYAPPTAMAPTLAPQQPSRAVSSLARALSTGALGAGSLVGPAAPAFTPPPLPPGAISPAKTLGSPAYSQLAAQAPTSPAKQLGSPQIAALAATPYTSLGALLARPGGARRAYQV
jgi:hypothetical protein